MFSKALNETLVYLMKNNKVLFIEKKRGFGAGFINGVGGKVEEGETIEDCAVREVKEEVGLKVKSLKKRGVILFINNKVEHILVHVFVSNDFEGTPKESEEAKPFWIDKDKIPFDKTWGDDKFWLPNVLNGGFVYAEFEFKNWKLVKPLILKKSKD